MLPLDGRRAGVHRTRVEYISNSEVPPEQLAAALGQERWQQIGVAAARAMERLRSLIDQGSKRLEDESFEDYKMRMKVEKHLVRDYLKGYIIER